MRSSPQDELTKLTEELRELERRLSSVRRRLRKLYVRLSSREDSDTQKGGYTPRRIQEVNRTNSVRLALILLGGQPSYTQLIGKAQGLGDFTRRELSSVPAKLVQKGEVLRKMTQEGHPTYELVDPFTTIGTLKTDPISYDILRDMVLSSNNLINELSRDLLRSYGDERKVFRLVDFLQTVENLTDKMLRQAIESALPQILSEWRAKGLIELTEGLEGVLISGRPVSTVSWKGERLHGE